MRLTGLLVFLGLFYSSNAQTDAFLSKFEVQTLGKNTIVSWTTSAGFTCQNLQIEHGTDSNHFEIIYNYPGICGFASEPEDYFYKVEQRLPNGNNYFRINLGTYGYSAILTTSILNIVGHNSIVTPNPANPQSQIRFDNDQRMLVTIKLISLNGALTGNVVSTTENHVSLSNFGQLASGFYYYSIDDGSIQRFGRFFLK